MDIEPASEGIELEALMATLVQMLAGNGLAREVAVLASAQAHFEYDYESSWSSVSMYRIVLAIPLHLHNQIQDKITEVEKILLEYSSIVTRAIPTEGITGFLIVPQMIKDEEWRSKAIVWLGGAGINNQGRVRSDNVAPRTFEGLLFRSQQEINLFKALRSRNISVAPLPVFTRGGESYQRIEPDFVIIKEGIMLVVEVDGDTFHHETPAQAYSRTMMLENEGARIIHIRAVDCDSPEKATYQANKIIETLAKMKAAK